MLNAVQYTWRIALPVFIGLLLLLLAANQATLAYLGRLWDINSDGPYAHGYLVLAVSLYLVYERREQLRRLTPCVNLWGGAAVMAVSLIHLAAILVDVQLAQAVGLLLLVLSLIGFVFGWPVTKRLLFPVLFIAYALPVWFPLSPFLQQITADVSFWFTRLLDVPAWLDDNIIVLPSGSLSVERACAGLNYLLAALTLSTLYAYLNYTGWRSRLLVVLIAAMMAVISNIIRVTVIVYLAYVTDMQHPWVQDHLTLGWMLFAALTAVLLLLDWWLHRGRESAEMADSAGQPAQPCETGFLSWLSITGVALVLLLPLVLVAQGSRQPGVEDTLGHLPSSLGSWRAVAVEDTWSPQYAGAVEQEQVYRRGSEQITLYLGYYPVQQQGRELINDLNRIYKPTVWRIINRQPIDYVINSIPLREQLLVDAQGERLTIWYWYEVAGARTANEVIAKLLQAWGMLSGRRQAAVFAIASRQPDIDEARRVLRDFIQQTGEDTLHMDSLLNRE